MSTCAKICGAGAIGLVLAIAFPILQIYTKLAPEQEFALMQSHNATDNPSNYASRYRGSDYHRSNRFFFQWWNYLVFDGETRDHFNLIYQITEFSNKFESGGAAASEGYTSMAHFTGAEFKTSSGDSVPLSDITFQNHWGMHLRRNTKSNTNTDTAESAVPNVLNRTARASVADAETPAEAVLQGIPYQQNLIDDDTYHILATIPADRSLTGVEIEWNLTFKRVHGVYGSEDSEVASHDQCLMLSTLFGYHSEVWGTIREGQKVYTITRTPRYRAYAAGSWGCTLPGGKPPIEYPWVWFWLIVPGRVPAQDLSMAWGGATLQAPGVGDVSGLFANTAVKGTIVSARKARILGGIPLQASTSDGFVSEFWATKGDWATYKDGMGSALIPLSQTFHLKTENYNITIAFTSRVEQYFRAPVWIESTGSDGKMKMFSDFRGVGVNAHITIFTRDAATAVWSKLYDLHTDSMNALEYAYEAELAEGYTPLAMWKGRFKTAAEAEKARIAAGAKPTPASP